MAEEKKSAVLEKLAGKFGDDIVATHSDFGDDTAQVRRERIVEICTFLRDDPGLLFDLAVDCAGVGYLGEEPRFEVVYHLYSIAKKHRVRIKARVPEEDPVIDSVIPVWAGMDWFGREGYDMDGIVFRNHPTLKRILMD